MKVTYIKIMIDFINNFEKDEVITRQQLLIECRKSIPYISDATIDTTRRQLTVCGYLRDSNYGCGQYALVKHIPENLNTYSLRNEYDVKIKTYYK